MIANIWTNCCFSPIDNARERLGWVEAGAAYFKVTVNGQGYYTPRLPLRGALKETPNPIVKMAAVIYAIEDWAAKHEKNYQVEYPVGIMVPKVAIGAIRGGLPFSPSLGVDTCSIYVDVRVPPPTSFANVQKEPLVDSIRKSHRKIKGAECPPVSTPEISMWRDVNIFNEVGIPSATFGFPRKTALRFIEKFVEIDDLVDCSKMYALVALDICGVNSTVNAKA
jgi:hypothetical protein